MILCCWRTMNLLHLCVWYKHSCYFGTKSTSFHGQTSLINSPITVFVHGFLIYVHEIISDFVQSIVAYFFHKRYYRNSSKSCHCLVTFDRNLSLLGKELLFDALFKWWHAQDYTFRGINSLANGYPGHYSSYLWASLCGAFVALFRYTYHFIFQPPSIL